MQVRMLHRYVIQRLFIQFLRHSFYLEFLHLILSVFSSSHNSTDLTVVRTSSPSSLVSVVRSTVSSSSTGAGNCVSRTGNQVSTMLIAVTCSAGKVCCVDSYYTQETIIRT